MFLAVSTKDWHDQDNYHEYKPGRERQEYKSYRVLGLNDSFGRLQEELWAGRYDTACRNAWPKTQVGNWETAVVTIYGQETHAIRAAIGLPSGDLYADQQEAFDSRWRALALLPMAANGSLKGRSLRI